MKLEYILLGTLLGRPRTGYDLKKFMDTHGRFLRSNTQMSQVYRSLTAMAERGWVSFTVQGRPGAQDAKIYRVTAEGASVFLDWLTGPYHPPTRFQDPDFGVRLHFAGFLTVDQLLALLDTELEARQRQVAKYRFRDRTEQYEASVPFDVELAIAINDRTHVHGAAAIDAHLRNLIELRSDLLDGRLPEQPSPEPTRKVTR